MNLVDLDSRHPATQQLVRFFTWTPPTEEEAETIDAVREICSELAGVMVVMLPDGPELSAGLRKLLEAKDCFVRAAL